MEFEAKVLEQRFKAIGANLNHAELFAAGTHFHARKVAPGETVIGAGTSVPAACVVVHGNFVVRAKVGGEDVDIVRLGPGTLIGEVSFLDGKAATANVIAETEGLVATLDHEGFARMERANPHAAMLVYRAFTTTLASRLRTATERLETLRGGGVDVASRGYMDVFRSLFGLGLT